MGKSVRECAVDATIENYSSSSPLGRQHYKHEMVYHKLHHDAVQDRKNELAERPGTRRERYNIVEMYRFQNMSSRPVIQSEYGTCAII